MAENQGEDNPTRIKSQMRFHKQLADVSRSPAFVGDFNLLDVSWKPNTAEGGQSRRFLEGVEDCLVTQLVRKPTGAAPAVSEQRRAGGRCGGWRLSWAVTTK